MGTLKFSVQTGDAKGGAGIKVPQRKNSVCTVFSSVHLVVAGNVVIFDNYACLLKVDFSILTYLIKLIKIKY